MVFFFFFSLHFYVSFGGVEDTTHNHDIHSQATLEKRLLNT
jgi:hypothetical protein